MSAKHFEESSKLRAELERQTGTDPVLGVMRKHNAPLDRETYIAMN